MPYGDDLDARFNELISQFSEEEQRRMRAAAVKGARPPRNAGGGARPPGTGREGGPQRRTGRLWVALALMCTVLAASGIVVAFRPDLLSPMPARPAATATAATPVAVPERLVNPFAGSPAQSYAEGVAGFVMPKAEAVGGLPEKQVAAGLKRTRALLAAAFLDRKTIAGGRPSAFMKLLHPDERSIFAKRLDRKGGKRGGDTRGWVTSLAPGSAELATDVIKVTSKATLAPFKEPGHAGAKVTTRFVVVYGVRRPGDAGSTMRLVVHGRATMLIYRARGDLVVWATDWSRGAAPSRCGAPDRFIHPVFPQARQGEPRPTGAPLDPYDLDAPETDVPCQSVRRT
ncbi:hypothetical protein AB0L05_35300 [Nonomuraea pusilla]|uniref:hypothetical protein n=1 Tax=Nonomuraea pusilla TaxID=46177 RepID=UPI0033341D86